MPTHEIHFYTQNPVGTFSTTLGNTTTYTGATAFQATALITDNAAGNEGLFLTDDSAGTPETATAVVTVGGTTYASSAVRAEEVWTIRDTVTNQTFQMVRFIWNDGTGNQSAMMSETQLVNGRVYETIDYDSLPDSAAGDLSFAYADFSDNFIEGTAGNDVIDESYTGDPQGDVVDGLDSFEDIYTPSTLQWSSFGGNLTDISGGVTQNVGGMNVSVSWLDEGAGQTFEVSTIDNYEENGENLSNTSSAEIYGQGSGDNSTTTISFTPASGSGYADEVNNVMFRINDIDQSQFQDIVTVRAFDADGNPVEVRLLADGGDVVTGNTVTANNVANGPGDADGSVLVTIPGPVSYIEIDYDNGLTSTQAIHITDINFDAVTPSYADSIDAGAGDDYVASGLGDDSVIGGTGNDTIYAGAGNDTVLGGADDDLIFGEDGADTIEAGTGNDTVDGGAGNDTIIGGAGNDSIIGGTGDDSVDGDDGNDTLIGNAGNDSLWGGDGDDSIDGGADNDSLGGDAGNDTIDGGAGDDALYGWTGDDLLTGGTGNDYMEGGDGLDTFIGGEGADTMIGGAGMDYVDYSASGAAVNVDYSAGTASGGDAAGDVITATDGIIGSDFDDTLIGFDTENLTAGPDFYTNVLIGGDGNDSIDGRGGNDSLYGDAGNDTILGGTGDDYIEGGADADYLAAGANDDTVLGGTGNDTIFGEDGADSLDGGTGDDLIIGGAGSDTMAGGDGDDTIYIGSDDVATGGAGDDLFVIDPTALTGGVITIDGMETSETSGDSLDFNGTLAGPVTYTAQGTDPGGRSGFATLTDGTVINFSNIETIICFARGTRILTPRGPVAIEALRPGDMVLTRDNGLQPIRWINSRRVAATGDFAPVHIAANTMGNDSDLIVSPQHRMLLKGHRPELLFGQREVLAAAKHLVNGTTINTIEGGLVEYFHMMFDQHELIFAEGAITESFHPGDHSLRGLADPAREELFTLFPELRALPDSHGPTARLCLRKHEAHLLAA
ncbi:MAG: Ca2+-binding RTX toxin-like protein [Halocynthiibacter sp.]|jgi:Ca2+-binding RTX toxin-like protein